MSSVFEGYFVPTGLRKRVETISDCRRQPCYMSNCMDDGGYSYPCIKCIASKHNRQVYDRWLVEGSGGEFLVAYDGEI